MAEYTIYENDEDLFVPESVMEYLGWKDCVNAANQGLTGLPFLANFEKVTGSGENYYKPVGVGKGIFSAGDGDTIVYAASSEVGI
jgi:hypothetical protein|tara:strand:- start:1336 stop:1590 length:255 start_codon:yes stop_codon:yes gene_type:complete